MMFVGYVIVGVLVTLTVIAWGFLTLDVLVDLATGASDAWLALVAVAVIDGVLAGATYRLLWFFWHDQD